MMAPPVLRLERSRRKLDFVHDYKHRRAAEADYPELVCQPFDLYDADSGDLVAVYRHVADDPLTGSWLDALAALLPTVPYHVTFRTRGVKTTSRVFGYLPRITIRRDFCTSTTLATEAPEQHNAVAAAAEYASRVYAQHQPDLYARHQAQAERILPDYLLPGGVFTSGIINENNPLRYHFDRGNITHTWSAMLAFKWATTGGHLSLPEWQIGVEIRDRSLFLFDGQRTIHGVTPILRLRPDSRRYTIVYYAMASMWNCLEPQAELARVRGVRTAREIRNDRTHPGLEEWRTDEGRR